MHLKFGHKEYFKTKYSALDGKTTIKFIEECEGEVKNEVRARGDGMWVQFQREVQTLKEAENLMAELRGLLAAGWEARMELKPKLVKTITGH